MTHPVIEHSSPVFGRMLTLNSSDRGGEEVLLDVGGQDATEAFEDVGHSDEAREILDGLLVGKLKRKVLILNVSVKSYGPFNSDHWGIASPATI